MPRPRRFRVLAIFAVVTLFALYRFSGSTSSWTSTGSLGSKWPSTNNAADDKVDVLVPPPQGPIATEDKQPDVVVPPAEKPHDQINPPAVPEPSKPAQKQPPPPSSDTTAPDTSIDKTPSPDTTTPQTDVDEIPSVPNHALAGIYEEQEALVPEEHGEGRKEVFIHPSASSIHWKKQKEHFPVTSTIQLPTGTPKAMPKIQYSFGKETAEDKIEREAKLSAIKEAFTFSWQGYRDYAWMHDELSPVTNGTHDPFLGWGATLVDTLDTLYIMGLTEEFDEAVNAVAEIDFTTSFRKDIPLFETVIRYLGGLIAAYDISEGKHRVLLDKAVELAEVLMGAFDTPNRMPVTFYYWMPTYASQPHRAGTRVVLAELGSLSMEFTRLAQLTKEPKYYDAIARITDAFYEWQDSTHLPGMFPVSVDASGCQRESKNSAGSALPPLQSAAELLPSTKNPKPIDGKTNPETKPDPQRFDIKNPVPDDEHDFLDDSLAKRQLDDPLSLGKAATTSDKDTLSQGASAPEILKEASKAASAKVASAKADAAKADSPKVDSPNAGSGTKPPAPVGQDCIPQGLTSPSAHGIESFTLGGMSDSLYEYFPKEYLLLGGLVPTYQTMYEKSMAAVRQNLLFKPMVPSGNRDLLFSGSLSLNLDKKNKDRETLKTEGTHLTCFAGGMFALGAKLFGIKGDLEIAEQLTEGCVWAYNSTTTGIMPESFLLVPCETKGGCEWSETKWHEALDPSADSREESYTRQMVRYSSQVAVARAKATEIPRAAEPVDGVPTSVAAVPTNAALIPRHRERRQLGDIDKDAAYEKANAEALAAKAKAKNEATKTSSTAAANEDPDKNDPIIGHIYKPQKPLSHDEYVKKRIEEERLPKGVSSFINKSYILRPEAIESVWYMYRITGDQHWREVGWAMFEAIQAHCRAPFGYSAIDDVSKSAPLQKDEMESFWLAETLKYFYLLFADEDLVSLDDWVLNTEAHPFRRPDNVLNQETAAA